MKYLKYMLSVMVMSGVVGSLPLFAAGKPLVESEVKKVQEALPSKPAVTPAKPRKIMIFDKCEGYKHGCVPLAGKTFEMMGEKSGAYEAVTFRDMSAFDAANLAKFDAVLFNNNTRLKFENPAHRKALLDFVKSGKGIVGIHAASDNFYNWPEAAEMMGGQFDGHPWTAGGTWAIKLDDPSNPINAGFGEKNFSIKDEIYQIKGAYSRNTHHVLLSLDMTQEVNKKVKGIKRSDNDFAIAWIKPCGKGRVFYSSLGHNNAVYWNPAVLQHYLDGIQYALGDLKADDTPSAVLGDKTNYDKIMSYEFGGDKTALGEITKAIKGASPAELLKIETKLIEVLNNPNATAPCKQFVCRMLRRCGTEDSIPALAALLLDKELSHMARFALQGIDSSEVDAALRMALSQVDQPLVFGMIDCLGKRRDALAVPALEKLLSSQDKQLAAASVIALGRIGTSSSVKALKDVALTNSGLSVTDALLTAAEHIDTEGNRTEAISIYKELFNDKQSTFVQVAALRGLVLTETEKSLPLLIDVLNNGNKDLKKYAVGIVSNLPAGLKFSEAIAKPLPTLTPDIQVALIGVLAERGDSVALSAIVASSKSNNPEIKGEALRALGILNDDGTVSLLIDALNDSDTISKIAAESLCRMSSPAIVEMLISELNKSDNATARFSMIEILSTRSDRSAIPSFITALKDSDSKVGKAAVKALGAHGSRAEAIQILGILTSSDDSGQRRNAEKAISMIAMQSKNVDEITRPVADALKNANQNVASSLISILKRTGGPISLAALENEVNAKDVTRRKDAVRALAGWGDASPADSLLQVAQTETDLSIKVMALRGYTGFASKAGGVKGVDMCREALGASTSPEDKKIVLGILGKLTRIEALALVEPFLTIPELQAEAETAYSAIAVTVITSEPIVARVALEKVATFQNVDLAENAKKALRKLNAQ